MRPSARCLAPGFVARSMKEFQRLSRIALTGEAITGPTREFPLVQFQTPEDLESCKTMSDGDMGGYSTAFLDYRPATNTEPSHARFHGTISTELPPNRPHIQRTGYAAWRTMDQGWSAFGKLLWDLEQYNYMAIQFKSDGRKYFINVQTDSLVPTDIHQHRLYSKHPGEWETLLVKFSEFVRTNHGQVVQPQRQMLTRKTRTVGIGLIDRVPGPFDLSISRIWATNGTASDEILRSVADQGPVYGLPLSNSTDGLKEPKKESDEES